MEMDINTALSAVVAVLTGLATAIPLIVKLVQVVKKSVQEKNWGVLLNLVMELMAEAEQKFADGATRKEWVIAMVLTSAEFVNYPIDKQQLSAIIDNLVGLTKVVNPPEIAEIIKPVESTKTTKPAKEKSDVK